MVVLHILLQLLNVGGTAVVVDIQTIGGIIDDVGLRAQCLKDALCDHPCTAIGAVQGHLNVLVRVGGQANQVADVTVPARGIVNHPANLSPSGIRQLLVTIQVSFDSIDDLLLHLFPVVIDELNPIVMEGIVTGRNHNAAVKLINLCDVGNAGGGGHMHQASVCPRGRNPGGQRTLKHITRAAGILTDHNFGLMLLAVIPAQKASHTESMVYC